MFLFNNIHQFLKIPMKSKILQKLQKVGHYIKSDKSLSRRENCCNYGCGSHKCTVIISELRISVSLLFSYIFLKSVCLSLLFQKPLFFKHHHWLKIMSKFHLGTMIYFHLFFLTSPCNCLSFFLDGKHNHSFFMTLSIRCLVVFDSLRPHGL